MSAWGVILKPGRKEGVPFVPPPEGGRLHVSQATLVGGDASTDVAVFYRPGGLPDEEEGGGKGRPPPQPLALTRLRGGGKSEAAALDLIFDHYAEFTAVAGGKDGAGAPAEVHLTGYELPDADVSDEEEEEDYDDEDEEELDSEEEAEAALTAGSLTPAALARAIRAHGGGPPGSSSEEDEEEEDDSEEDDSEFDSEDEEEGGGGHPDVVIEELDGSEGEEKKVEGKKGKGKAAAVSESEEELSEDDSGSPSSSGSEDEESDEDDDEPDDAPVAPAPAWGKKGEKAAEPAAEPSKKRPAAPTVFAPAPPPAKKAAPAPAPAPAPEPPAPAPKKGPQTLPPPKRYENGFVIETLALGRPGAAPATAGKRVEVKYIGRLASNGSVFDQTKGRSTFKFILGVQQVIKGWDAGVVGMRVGEKRRLIIPPQMGYGAAGSRPAIPGNATLDFTVELVSVR